MVSEVFFRSVIMPLPSELAMSPDELDNFMRTCVHMRIATFSPGGRINVTPLVYGWADGKVYTLCRGQKVRNLRRNPNATVIVDRNELYHELQGAMLQGTAIVLEDVDAEMNDPYLEEARLQMGEKYSSPSENGKPPRHSGSASGRTRRWVVFTPDRVVTWDNTKNSALKG